MSTALPSYSKGVVRWMLDGLRARRWYQLPDVLQRCTNWRATVAASGRVDGTMVGRSKGSVVTALQIQCGSSRCHPYHAPMHHSTRRSLSISNNLCRRYIYRQKQKGKARDQGCSATGDHDRSERSGVGELKGDVDHDANYEQIQKDALAAPSPRIAANEPPIILPRVPYRDRRDALHLFDVSPCVDERADEA